MTEAEVKVKKEALDDAISSTKAAIAAGIVPGAGQALPKCFEAVTRSETACEGGERTGVQIFKRALEASAHQIAENSAVDGGVVVARIVGGEGSDSTLHAGNMSTWCIPPPKTALRETKRL